MLGSQASTVAVGPFRVLDVDPHDLPDLIVSSSIDRGRPTLAFALHVGGLNHAEDAESAHALNKADFLYADGVSVVALAKLAGAKHCSRTPTTDLGWLIIERLALNLGRPPEIALIGGPPGLAERAGRRLEQASAGTVVSADHGFQSDWHELFIRVSETRPDVVIVGLGMPLEAKVVVEHFETLPDSLILTCGGWFGFLAGDEARAPRVLQRFGLEWSYRLLKSPGRLWLRYLVGLITTIRCVPTQLKRRSEVSG